MLAQGGEFAFVLLSLAEELKVLPEDLNKLLIIVVVLSMALTPLLADIGKTLAERTPDADREYSWSQPWSEQLRPACFSPACLCCGTGTLCTAPCHVDYPCRARCQRRHAGRPH